MQVKNVKFKHRENIQPLKASSQDRLSSKLSNGAVKKIVSSISISKAHEQYIFALQDDREKDHYAGKWHEQHGV